MPTQEQKKTTQQIPFKQKAKDFFRETGIVIVGFLLLNNFVIASFMVPTGSMENEVLTGDFLMVNKFIYGGCSPRNIPFTDVRLPWFRLPAFKSVHRGDVIVFVFPGMRDEAESPNFTYYLKRCMAVAGDTLQVINRVVYINGRQAPIPRNMKFNSMRILPSGYADDRIFPPGAPFNEDNYGPIVIPKKGMTIVLTPQNFQRWNIFIRREGHKPTLEADGQILIDGKPATTYTVERNYLFGMGDNRDNSLDSRYWGFVPEENVVGTPMFVYWSWDEDTPIYNIFAKLASVRLNRIGKLIE
ncbi:MAG: signal peptidase I [Bacteroidota bacterium]|nr:signal peptidase I [Bacteroidota bacterium]